MIINKKSHIYIFVIMFIIISILTCVYFRGTLGAYAWNFALFILGPIGVILSIIQLVCILVNLYNKKDVKIVIYRLIISVVMAFPVLILIGAVNIFYPMDKNLNPAIKMNMPIKGERIVLFGGIQGKEHKPHAIWPSECYAYDILMEPYDTGDDKLDNYGIYGRDVFATVNGKIIETHDGEKDILPNTEEFTSSLGNYIFIEIEETKTYLILAHLKQGSVMVKQGDEIKIGDVLAKVGNSGTTSEPHLHIQHQRNNPSEMIFPTCSEGLPIIIQ